MAIYDFRELSSYDFELLVRDSLQPELGTGVATGTNHGGPPEAWAAPAGTPETALQPARRRLLIARPKLADPQPR